MCRLLCRLVYYFTEKEINFFFQDMFSMRFVNNVFT
jgi:hypothetical protein